MHDRRWQYKVLTVKPSPFASAEKADAMIEEVLTRQGLEGWELINAVLVSHYYRLFFKR
ncbi:uncharacterized protein DUF4177 [Litorimonas taeanensis]|uniref:Uncharacterized protein DUF4177 n=1 Tax=Litorimonas taeanensis TaxID=568099 RepID=A0A420WFL9_9PROT|nr:DUF4177 domain-containing protein [Litorimonas taeanensis]RKQ69804.1 uncharacterized protein DUF4177 [Litorimonas taeanensis]